MKINPSMYSVSTNKIKINKELIKTNSNYNSKVDGFSKVLQEKLNKANELNFSKHANMRLNSRKIIFSDEQLKRINEGIDQAKEKGIKDSLVLIDDVALVVNIKNKTVVTAMEKSEQDNKIITNIDGAVII
ncbi:TIGR02530 family flagellar biosynthesis protein [Vallitalea sp.]|jgi:flagellar operon protein|uniref:TIGR02530 family flagellar biosynthesis protein n=1 Tax=Vallitalea sp. TaxID=1882829 RepID=UPI0025FD0FF5|nr:TIGR02530 family flagellar biosynthesis protein [Vallitalea sp.]MCT4688229.1 flagellar biosynthesis protein [Vallitalea sp.]